MTRHNSTRDAQSVARPWRRWAGVAATSLALASMPATAFAGSATGPTTAPRAVLQAVGVTLNPTTVEVSESGTTDTYTVVLSSEPTADVTVTLATPGGQAIAVSTVGGVSTLTFTDADWNTPQSITVTAVDDNVAEGDHTTAVTHTASGGGYDSVSIGNVSVEIDDDDVAGASVSPGTVNVAEGGATATYTLVLNSEPTADVTVTIAPSSAQLSATATATGLGTLTFTSANWNTPQSVTVTAVNDGVVEGNHAGTVAHSASGGGYASVPIAGVTVNIADDDTGVIVSASSVRVREGGDSKTYTVVLGVQPTGDVTVTIGVTGGQATAVATSGGGSSLTFTTANWSTPQSVTVEAVDDDAVEGSHDATITHTASGGGLSGASIPSVEVEIRDNDGRKGDNGNVSDQEKPEACNDLGLHPSLKALCSVLDRVPPQARAVIAGVIERHAERTPPGQQGREDRDDRDGSRRDRADEGDEDEGDENRGRRGDGDEDDDDRDDRRKNDKDDRVDDAGSLEHGRPSWANRRGGPNR